MAASSSMISSSSLKQTQAPPFLGPKTSHLRSFSRAVGPGRQRGGGKKIIGCFHGSRMNAVRGKVPSTADPISVPLRVALELLQAGHRFLDVRTPEEFRAGHAPGATNIPYMFSFGSGMSKNPRFLEQAFSEFGKYDEIIVGCQRGTMSLIAANDLLRAGFTGVTNMAGGYATWIENGLPLES